MERKNQNGIKTWPISDHPREKACRFGVEKLSDAELLAVILRQGIRGKDAVVLSRELLTQFGGLRKLLASDWPSLERIRGLGPAKITALLAVNELARRQLKEKIFNCQVIRDPETVVEFLYASFQGKVREIFKCLFLDRANRLIEERDLFQGTVDQSVVHPREVVKAALDCHATSVILVHNHPSGRVEPSVEDKEVTRKLQLACQTVSVEILDHLIIGEGQYFSFREHQLLGCERISQRG
ncbi:MAG: DNA repair protein RadC [Candidatus Omnitrophica bacterium]|nr:DNA repair protein RadC [Candidatus Omnitrophota bacterium]